MYFRYDCDLHTLITIYCLFLALELTKMYYIFFHLSWWCCASFGRLIIYFYNTNVRSIVDYLNIFILCTIMCTNRQVHVIEILLWNKAHIGCRKSNCPTIHIIIYRRGQCSGRDCMVVSFKSSYVINILSPHWIMFQCLLTNRFNAITRIIVCFACFTFSWYKSLVFWNHEPNNRYGYK